MVRIKMYIFKAELPFYPPNKVKCGLQNEVSTNAPAHLYIYIKGSDFKEPHVTHQPLISPPHTTHSQISLLSASHLPSSFVLFLFLTNTHSSLHSLTLPQYPLHTTTSTIIFLAKPSENSLVTSKAPSSILI